VNCWDISGIEGVSQCYFDCGFQLLWVKVACGSVSEFIVVSYLLLYNLSLATASRVHPFL
jgi:hypothetical protein